MTSRRVEEFDLATMENITFDEIFPNSDSPAMDDGATARRVSPLHSIHCDRFASDVPSAAPLSPYFSDELSATSADASVTSGFSDVADMYRVDPRVLGAGHQGSVRVCMHRSTGQRYAVKTIRKSDPAVELGSLEREIMLLLEMRNRNVVRLVDVHEDSECVHLVTELCEGGELFGRIVEKSSGGDDGAPCFEEDEAARIMREILTAVRYIHDHDVCHRDIKPENILFETADEGSPIKLVDFGLARKHFPSRERAMTSRVGTPYYMAPEVLQGRYGKSCDLWSVGVIAYILLCGYPPFNGSNTRELNAAVRRAKFRFPSEEWSGVSEEAKDFVCQLLQKNPRKRMDVEQALDHPWLARCVSRAEEIRSDVDNQGKENQGKENQGSSSLEGLFCGFSMYY